MDVAAHLDAEERAKIADVLVSKSFADGEYIIRQGEEGDFFYIIQDVSASDVGGACVLGCLRWEKCPIFRCCGALK